MSQKLLHSKDESGPTFREPWEAQAFSLVTALMESGLFTAEEWASTLGETIRQAQSEGDPDLGNTYYQHWLNALETLVLNKEICDRGEMADKFQQWRSAFLATPHGQPVSLETDK